MMNPKPIFLISLPRSGSTLLQRMLMGHSHIASHSEPWFLLPLIYGIKKNGIRTDYGHKSANVAMKDLQKSLGGTQVYEREIAKFALKIYEGLAEGKQFFVDKTPRYYFIAKDLIRIFPSAKFIVLLRNPLSVLASNIEAFKGNSIRRLDHLDRDLYLGPKRLEAFLEAFRDHENVITLNYDDLVTDPETNLRDLIGFLDLDFEETTVFDFASQKIDGYGDHLGSKQYSTIKNQNHKWKAILSTTARCRLAENYLAALSDAYLEHLGMDRGRLLIELHQQRPRRVSVMEYAYLIESQVIRLAKRMLNYNMLT